MLKKVAYTILVFAFLVSVGLGILIWKIGYSESRIIIHNQSTVDIGDVFTLRGRAESFTGTVRAHESHRDISYSGEEGDVGFKGLLGEIFVECRTGYITAGVEPSTAEFWIRPNHSIDVSFYYDSYPTQQVEQCSQEGQ